jgi:hypothetical protein
MFENGLFGVESGEDGFVKFVADLALDWVVFGEARHGVEFGDDSGKGGVGDVELLDCFAEFLTKLVEFDVGSVLAFAEGDLHLGEADYAEVVSDPGAQVGHGG